MRRNPVLAFYLLAFGISWLAWLPRTAYSYGWFPFDSPLFLVLGGAGPLLAPYVVLRASHGRQAMRELVAPLLRWRVSIAWYVLALLGFPAIWIASLAASGRLDLLDTLGPASELVPLLAARFVAAIPEELGWRGFVLPRLQARHSALVASFIVGSLWALWHLPLLLVTGSRDVVPMLIEISALAVVYTWLLNSTGGSVLIATLFHAASNTVGPFAGIEQTATVLVVACAIVLLFGPAHLSRRVKYAVGGPTTSQESATYRAAGSTAGP